ncbi:purine-nucleoside phosphorylase [Nocardiopsis mwathae]|nr:purine-nucleoside phosphorylase [Nocardiopsis mwathae]
MAQKAAEELRSRTGVTAYDAALVMGSGWAPAADLLGDADDEFPSVDLPGFLPPAVQGHSGTVRSVARGDKKLLVFLGRTHLYEGHGPDAVAHGVRTAVAAGASTVILTNAAGSLDPKVGVGTPVLIADHLNLTTRSPLTGATFVDLSRTYSARLRDLAKEAEPSLSEGVYAAMPGPHFETPAEIRMLRSLGADLVGMSTVLEAIAARELGAEVLGISLVTNIAAGLEGADLDHQEVLAAGRRSAGDVGALLAAVTDKL